jgi:hypothetical protein
MNLAKKNQRCPDDGIPECRARHFPAKQLHLYSSPNSSVSENMISIPLDGNQCSSSTFRAQHPMVAPDRQRSARSSPSPTKAPRHGILSGSSISRHLDVSRGSRAGVEVYTPT